MRKDKVPRGLIPAVRDEPQRYLNSRPKGIGVPADTEVPKICGPNLVCGLLRPLVIYMPRETAVQSLFPILLGGPAFDVE